MAFEQTREFCVVDRVYECDARDVDRKTKGS